MLEKNYSSVTRFTPMAIVSQVEFRPGPPSAFRTEHGLFSFLVPAVRTPGREIVFCSFFTPAEEEPYVAANNPHGPDF